MSDLIKRSDAIKAVSKVDDYGDGIGFEVRSHCLVELELVPSADRPQGEWIFRREFVEDTPFTGYRCSNCNYWQGMGAWNFCPNCGARMSGARMKGADDE